MIVDKLLSLAVKDGTATISSVKYQGAELLRMYMERILAMIRAEYPGVPVAQLVISLENMEMKADGRLMGCADVWGSPGIWSTLPAIRSASFTTF